MATHSSILPGEFLSHYDFSLKNTHIFHVLVCPGVLVVGIIHNLEMITIAHKFSLQNILLTTAF